MFMQKFHKKYAIFAETSTKILNKEMELIPSFAVDHTNLQPGIYVSRRDEVGGEAVTTYDIRMTIHRLHYSFGIHFITLT